MPKKPLKAKGCTIEAWLGAMGLDTDLTLSEGGFDDSGEMKASPIARHGDLTKRQRQAIAKMMIQLWGAFANDDSTSAPAPAPPSRASSQTTESFR